MNTYANTTEDNKCQSVANAVAQKKSEARSTFEFVGNRPEAVAQRKLQDMAYNNPQVAQLRFFQDIANTKQSAQLQATAINYATQNQSPIQKKANNTGLPDELKSGIENLSGHSMDDVKVHYDSDKPAQLQAHAYAQGSDIHLASGQEKHLPHEAWHVVQQKQGMVRPTMQTKEKVNINDNVGLEKEADLMGAKALQLKNIPQGEWSASVEPTQKLRIDSSIERNHVVQGMFYDGFKPFREDKLAIIFNSFSDISFLKGQAGLFKKKNQSKLDEGQFYNWVMSFAEDEKAKAYAHRRLVEAGVDQPKFASALEKVGSLEKTMVHEEHLDIEEPDVEKEKQIKKGIPVIEIYKKQELEDFDKYPEPPSPRGKSRLIQVPNLINMILGHFSENPVLKHFQFILGGGSALSLKKLDTGRFGRPSENMRDIDMDFQLKQPPSEEAIENLGKLTESKLMEIFLKRIKDSIAKLPEKVRTSIAEFHPPSITGGNTIIFKTGDLEYSFHYLGSKTTLGFDQIDTASGPLAVINDPSHWKMTKSALLARLSRPDKLYKTLVDACVLIGDEKEKNRDTRINETAEYFSKELDILEMQKEF